MSRRGAPKGKKPPGTEFTWDADPGGEPDTAPTPLYPKYTVPFARKLSPAEQTQVDYYRELRESFHEGPFYSVLDASSSNAKKGSAARANFDAFHGMPTYSGRYQKKRRTLPKITGRSYFLKFFPRELWQTLQPNFRPDASLDGYQAQASVAGVKRGFEDEEDEAGPSKRTAGGDDDEDEGDADADADEAALIDGDDEQEEELMDDDFSEDDDEMGGDYNAEQYFDDGEDDMGDEDGGGGGGDDDF